MSKRHNQYSRSSNSPANQKNRNHTPLKAATIKDLPGDFSALDMDKQRHPPHLTRKEIGLWYAEHHKKQKKPCQKETFTLTVHLSANELEEIRGYLSRTVMFTNINKNLDWKKKYHTVGASCFKDKFFENLAGNDSTTFGTTNDTCCMESLIDIPDLNKKLSEQLLEKLTTNSYYEMLEKRSKLPIWDQRDALLHKLKENQVIVVCGETGCGKTTQVPQYLLDDAILNGRGSTFRAICTQPRRIAAISVAQRVADERCESCGGSESSVGYQIRLEKRLPRQRGSILYCTTGILVQYLQSNPHLADVSHLLLDEIHERDIFTDFLLTFVKNLLPKRPSLRVILMSATIDSNVFSTYFKNCLVMEVPGFTYPVENLYLEDVLSMIDYRVRPKFPKRFRGRLDSSEINKDIEYTKLMVPFIEDLEKSRKYPWHVTKSLRMRESEDSPENLLVCLLKYICTEQKLGAILVFLQGWEQISKLHKLLLNDKMFASRKYLILPLHSMMPTVNQRGVFDKPATGVRKIILSTNIAETSLTIDDVVYVIDCGKVKQSSFDAKKNLSTLNAEWISRASSRQRQGRAGRTQPGVCYRLYSKGRESNFEALSLPEMRRVRLEELILRVKILKLGKIETFLLHVPDPPDPKTVRVSLDLLRSLGALDDAECLTPLGFHLAQLPTDPRTGKLILLAAIFGCLEPLLSVAAALNFKDPFVVPLNSEEAVRKAKKELALGLRSDHLLIAKVMREYRDLVKHDRSAAGNYCHKNFLSSSTMAMLLEITDLFCRELHERKFLSSCDLRDPKVNVNSSNHDLIRAILCAGLLPNVARVSTVRQRSHSGGQRRGPHPKVVTVEDGRVAIHPRSVNANSDEFQSSWLCYHTKVRTTSIYLHECSEVLPTALLFFADDLKKKTNGKVLTVEVARGIEFQSDRHSVDVLEHLRSRWNDYLEYRVSHPGVTDWSVGSQDLPLLRAIMTFVTSKGEQNKKEIKTRQDSLRLDRSCYDLVSPQCLHKKRQDMRLHDDLDNKAESDSDYPGESWDAFDETHEGENGDDGFTYVENGSSNR